MPERPTRLEAVLRAAREQGYEVRSGAATEAEGGINEGARELVSRVHDPAYVERFHRAVERGDGLLDSADNPLSAGTWDAAWGAVDAALAATRDLRRRERRRPGPWWKRPPRASLPPCGPRDITPSMPQPWASATSPMWR